MQNYLPHFFLAMAGGLLACSAVDSLEDSKYDPGPNNGKAPTTDADGADVSDDSGSDRDYDFGLTECVSSYLTAEKLTTARPPELTVTLGDFASKTSLATLAEWTDLADLLLRADVTSSKGLVDYAKLKSEHAALWSLLVTGLKTLSPPSGEDSETISYWINAYNVVMMNFIIEKSLTDVTTDFGLFKEKVDIGGHSLSLDQIEKGILKLGGGEEEYPSELVISTLEPRLHFALVCAAISCPRLRNFAYRSSILDGVLAQNELMFFNSETHLTSTDGIKVSSLFNWFADDFNELATGSDAVSRRNLIETKVLSQCRADGKAIADEFAAKSFKELSSIPYNWTVNAK